MKKLGKRPNCPECKGPDPISRGLYWTCRGCHFSWVKVFRGRSKARGVRPDCIACGANGKEYVISNGDRWICRKCDKVWMKIHRPRFKDFGERPPCPDCGTPIPLSCGNRWECSKCGRSWFKFYRSLNSFSSYNLHQAPVCEI